MTKKDAGSLGGKSTFEKYGADHMREIGRRGARVLWERYNLLPYELSKYALVDRSSGHVKAVR